MTTHTRMSRLRADPPRGPRARRGFCSGCPAYARIRPFRQSLSREYVPDDLLDGSATTRDRSLPPPANLLLPAPPGAPTLPHGRDRARCFSFRGASSPDSPARQGQGSGHSAYFHFAATSMGIDVDGFPRLACPLYLTSLGVRRARDPPFGGRVSYRVWACSPAWCVRRPGLSARPCLWSPRVSFSESAVPSSLPGDWRSRPA